MYVIHYTYLQPNSYRPDGTSVKEEYELYAEGGEWLGIYYTNPFPNLPVEHVVI